MKPNNFWIMKNQCALCFFHNEISMIFITSISCYSEGDYRQQEVSLSPMLRHWGNNYITILILLHTIEVVWDVKLNIFLSVTTLEISTLDMYSENFIFQNCADNAVNNHSDFSVPSCIKTRKKYWLHGYFKEVGTCRRNWNKKFGCRDGFNLKCFRAEPRQHHLSVWN